jgi:hypothetical protein
MEPNKALVKKTTTELKESIAQLKGAQSALGMEMFELWDKVKPNLKDKAYTKMKENMEDIERTICKVLDRLVLLQEILLPYVYEEEEIRTLRFIAMSKRTMGGDRIAVIKKVREMLGLGLKASKDLVDAWQRGEDPNVEEYIKRYIY